MASTVAPRPQNRRALSVNALLTTSMARASLRGQAPEVGAACGNPAHTVLCGGRSAVSVPTAIATRVFFFDSVLKRLGIDARVTPMSAMSAPTKGSPRPNCATARGGRPGPIGSTPIPRAASRRRAWARSAIPRSSRRRADTRCRNGATGHRLLTELACIRRG